MQWDAMRRDRKFLPESIEADSRDDVAKQLERIVKRSRRTPLRVRCEVMTDQVDVFLGERRIGTYMP